MQCVVVVGTSGSGKTTVARLIAEKLGLHHIELDSIHWGPDWTEIPDQEFIEIVERETRTGGWTVDGNYRVVRDVLWPRADTLVWLDLPFRIIFWRMIKRTVRRIWTKEELWNGNVERLDALIGADSMPLWVIKTYWRRKREYPEHLAKPGYSHLDVYRLRTTVEIDNFLENLS